MAYHIEGGESVRHMLRRIARDEVGDAVAALAEAESNRPKAVHSARKRIKRLRALARLVRDRIGGAEFRAADARLRDAGRRLATARDATILVETLDDLAGRYADSVKPSDFAGIRKALMSERRKALGRLRSDDSTFGEVAGELAAAGDEIVAWKVGGKSTAVLADGVAQSYRLALERFERARKHRTDVRLHDWRKATKTLGYQLRALEPIWKPGLRGVRSDLERLADRLGDHQDLVVLHERAKALAADRAPGEVEPLVALLDRRRDELWEEACTLGGPIFAERPRALRRRFAAYVEFWKRTSG